MKTTQKELKTETATQAFYREVSELKPRLPKDWKMRFVNKYPNYDSYRGGLQLHYVINLDSTNMEVLKGLKEIIAEYEKEPKKD